MKTLTRKTGTLLIVASMAFCGCDKTDLTSEEILKMDPGGIVSFELRNEQVTGIDTIAINDTAEAYGLVHTANGEEGESMSYFSFQFSGETGDIEYYFYGQCKIPTASLNTSYNGPYVMVNNATTEFHIKKSGVIFATTHNADVLPAGQMTLSRAGSIGDSVTIQYRFIGPTKSGYVDLAGTIKTKYAVSPY